ncbi:MAG: glycosyltransferase family A protein [Leptolyngbyaceae bacterium]|nr:glycosyltransferase family A protein [Leptolyngbyaceae bacterium]
MNPCDFRVSVVITSYNQKGYLIEALESVICQTVRPHEIIVADDCSTDGSVEVIHDYMQQYPGWVKGVFQHRNAGIPVNRNSGLRHVTGNYVSILDGDDLFAPTKLEQELNALRQHPNAQCVYSNVQFINSVGQPMGIRDQADQPSGDIFSYVAPGRFGLPRSMLIHYPVFKSIGFFDEHFPKYDGFDITIQLAARCQFVYVSAPLVDYRVHDSSDSTGLNAQAHLHDLEGIYQKLKPLLTRLSSDERGAAQQAWNKRLFRWRIFDAVQQGQFIRAIALIWTAFFRDSLPLKDVARMVKAAYKGETYRNTLLRKA